MYNMNLIGTVMKWEDIVKEFPDRWVLLIDCVEGTHDEVISARLMAACIDTLIGGEYERVREQIGDDVVIRMERTTRAWGVRW